MKLGMTPKEFFKHWFGYELEGGQDLLEGYAEAYHRHKIEALADLIENQKDNNPK